MRAVVACGLFWALAGAVEGLSGQAPPVAPVGRLDGPIHVDGVLDEASWGEASPLGDLTMVEPVEGRDPTFRTEVRILAGAENLYIGIRAVDPEPSGIVSYAKARDSELRSEDHVKIVLDPFRDGQSGYVFAVNPGGARYDALVAEQGLGENASWDAVWEAGTRRSEAGWTAELRIPLQSLSFRAGLDAWGFNLERRVQRTLEVSRWASPTRDAVLTQTTRAGRITGLPRFETGLGLTVRPSVSGGVVKDDPDVGWDDDVDPSLDVFKRLGSNATAVVTLNTDFAETEVDTRRTNLTRFPLFFPEKRSFFLDGADIFDFGAGLSTFHSPDLVPFFTRRIGLVEGRQVPLRVGGKVTGRSGRTSFGGLVTRTGAVEGLVQRTGMGAFRFKQTLLERSSAGVLATFGDPLGREGSYTLGGDFVYNTSSFLGGRNLLVGVWGLATDREELTGDRTAVGGIVDFPNDPWDLWVAYKRIGESFDPSLGFVPRPGVHLANAGLNYRWWSPTGGVRNAYFELVPILAWDLTGRLESYRIFTAPLNVRFESGDRVELNVQPQGERLFRPFEIADGVVLPEGRYDWVRYRAEVDFAGKRLLSGRVSWWFGPFYDGDVSELSLRLALNPSDVLTFELSGVRNRGTLPAGEIRQEIVGSRVRVNFSPDLQLSVFGQYEREAGAFGLNTRFRWTFDPLGDLFVIYNHNSLDLPGSGWET
ncbi:MAG: DUF5916 domain-containing protein, partial [Gemmatimonadota bacterium]